MSIQLSSSALDGRFDPRTGVRILQGIVLGDWGVDPEGHPYWNPQGAQDGELVLALGWDEQERLVIVP